MLSAAQFGRVSRWWVKLVITLVVTSCGIAQQSQSQSQSESKSNDELVITTRELPATGLWKNYSFSLEANQEVAKWRLVGGALPRNVKLHNSGTIEGVVNEQGTFSALLQATGRDGLAGKPKSLTLVVETPLKAEWSQKSRVNGNRIDGSIKVSNATGRDFDLTFVVLAVNEIGRATAIGYQHFPFKSDTREMELPFGDTLSPGSYDVNIDVVAEEPTSQMIFRARLVAAKQTIAPVL
jgi:hypothetical protein